MNNYINKGIIYELNFLNGKYKYIGSTKRDLIIRYEEHLKALYGDKHVNIIMQNIYNKYKNIPEINVIEVLFNCTIEELLNREQYYIDKEEYNLNISKIAGVPSIITNKIIQYDENGIFIKIWDSAVDAAIVLNLHPTSIRNCTYGINKSSGNWQWKFYKEDFIENIGKIDRIKPIPPINEKEINIYDLYGNLLKECKNRKECANFININISYIYVIKNKKIYKDFFICDKELYNENKIIIPIKRVGKYDLNGNLIKIYAEPTMAMKEINKPNTHIFSVLNGRQKTCFGYTYCYIENEIIYKIDI